MKKSVAIILLVLGVFVATSSAVEVTLFGPNQYIRTSGSPDVFTDAFAAYPGTGTLIVKNGDQVGEHRIIDAISSAEILVNGVQIFGPNDFNQNVYLLEAPLNLGENNSITIELASQPDSYITVEVIADIDPPSVTFSADPATIFIGESSTLSWQTTNADSCVIDAGTGSVDINGNTVVSPTQTTAYTITATGLGGTTTAAATVTILNRPPVADVQEIATGEDIPTSITLSGSDPDGDSLTFIVNSQPLHGTLAGTAPDLTYTPDENYNGSDSFSFTVNDGTVDSDPATVNITVAAVNDAPVANAQTVTLNEDESKPVVLTAFDVEGDTLTYEIVGQPSNGTLSGTAPDLTYTPDENYHGDDSFSFRVNDGNLSGNTAIVSLTINPVNDAPLADAGSDQTVSKGDAVSLNGGGSSDVDGDALSYQWLFSSVPAGSTATLSDPSIVNPGLVPDIVGTYTVQLIVNDGTVDSAADTVVITADPRMVTVPDVVGQTQADAEAALTGANLTVGTISTTYSDTIPADHVISQAPAAGASAVEGSAVDLVVSLGPVMVTVPNVVGLAQVDAETSITGANLVVGTIATAHSDTVPAGNVISQNPAAGTSVVENSAVDLTVSLGPANQVPVVSFSAVPLSIAQGGSATLSWTSVNAQSAHIDNGIGTVALNDSMSVSPEHTTTYTLSVTGSTGSASARVTIMVTGSPEPQPEGAFGEQFEDLIPPDATVEFYDDKRFSVITGLVQNIVGLPITDVSITIHGHPEYGTVATDAEGRFSIPVEGGSTITVAYQKDGLISAHRKVYVPWNDFAIVDAIQMIVEDTESTTVVFDGNADTVVTHRSTAFTDEFGTRAFTMVFTGDNRAWQVDENGNDVHELSNISVRATEYTTPESMPAVLPPTSAYTYCAELQVDGVQRVQFENPVVGYVENFIGFDVGTIAPVGFYDRDRGVWVPSQNGVVVKLLDTDSDGVVDALDADGDDQPDVINGEEFSDEVIGLDDPSIYAPGATFWRIEMRHFTPCDINWPYVPPLDAILPNAEKIPTLDDQECSDDDCEGVGNSYVEERSRVFHEDIPIAGTDLTLHYASNRINTNKIAIHVPLSGETVPNSLKQIVAKIKYFMHAETKYLDPLPNQNTTFEIEIDRKISRLVVFTGFTYDGYYNNPSPRYSGPAFAKFGMDTTNNDISFNEARNEVTVWRIHVLNISPPIPNNGTFNLISDGWTISNNHTINPSNPSVLNKGDGDKIEPLETDYKYRKIDTVNLVENIAGNRTQGYGGDGGPATQAQLASPRGIAVDAAGNIFIADYSNYRVRKVDRDGTITTVAGNGTQGYSGDGGPAIYAQLYRPRDVAVDAAGNLYIADTGCAEWGPECDRYPATDIIRKVDTNGIITTVAGDVTGGEGEEEPNDGGDKALGTILYGARSVATDPFGNFYIGEYEQNVILQVDPNGILSTIVGNGIPGYSGDGGSAGEAQLNRPKGIALDAAGNLYIADSENHCIRKVDPSGFITTIAGDGNQGYSGDGGPAQEARLYRPIDVNLDVEGNIYIVDSGNQCVRKVNTEGIIYTVAGQGANSYNSDGVPVDPSWYTGYTSVAVDDSGMMYVSFSADNVISSVGPLVPYVYVSTINGNVFADKNGLGYYMTPFGLHLKTIDLNTGITLQEFGYDSSKRIVSILDRSNNETRIERGSGGIPTAIISPDNIRTELTIDANNFLTHITYPDGNYYKFEYSPEGLMTAEIEPEGNRFTHSFTPDGKIADVIDEEGWHTSYEKAYLSNGDILTEVFTAEGNRTTYLDRTDSSGNYTSIITDSTGGVTDYSRSGPLVNKTLPCGTVLQFKNGIDPKYRYKFIKEKTEETPAGLAKTVLRDKTYTDTNADDVSDLITETVAVNNKTTSFENSVLQSQKTVTTPEGRTVTTQYNPATLLTDSVSVPGLHDTNYGYDARGRLTSISTNTRQSTFAYSSEGFLESVTDSENHTTTYSHDAVGRVTGVSRPDSGFVGFTYDKNGNMTVLTNPVDVDHGFGFNKANLNNTYQTPLSGNYSYVYDKDRRLIQTNFPSGKTIINDYADPSDPDDKSSLWQIRTPEGNIDFTYLCGSKVDSITKGPESINYDYDGKLITSETLNGTLNQSLDYTYNNDFDVLSFNYAGGTVNYAYDNDGLLTGAGSYTVSRIPQNGLPETVSGGALSLGRGFNGYGEVDGQGFTVGSQNPASWTLTRDNNGRITQKTETINGVISNYLYTYDSMGRLLTVNKDAILVEEYGYDLSGTRISETNTLRGIAARSFSYSDEDHLLSAGSVTYVYDLDGFLTTKTDGSDITNYTYSSRGELLDANLPDGRTIEYIHDPLGRRIAKKIDGVITEKYLWQGLTRLLAVYDGSDNLLMRFDYADGRMPVAVASGGSTYYLTYDQVGSLQIVADGAGNVVKSIQYDSFGNITNDTNPAFEMPFGFAGGLHDQDTGLVRFGYRDYDPDVGRWTAKDPIGFAGGDTDLYGYVLNDPVNFIDPDGLRNWGKVVPGALLTGIGAIAVTGGVVKAVYGATHLIAGAATLNPIEALAGVAGIAQGLGMVVVGGYMMHIGIPMLAEGWTEGETGELPNPCK